MNIRALHLAAALAVAFASTSMADISGSTYNFTATSTGGTSITGFTPGTHTDPANPGFCVGPPNACGSGNGMSGSFAFADPSPTLSTITFQFFGSNNNSGTFSIDLANLVPTDGDTITNVTYASGNLNVGNFSGVTWNGTTHTAVFTGSTNSNFDAVGGSTVVFDVIEAGPSAVPEPSSIWLACTILGGLLVGFKKLRHA